MSTKLLGFLRVTYQENTMMYVMIIQIMNVYQAKSTNIYNVLI